MNSLVDMQYELIEKGWKDDLLKKPADELSGLMAGKQKQLQVGRGRQPHEAQLARSQGGAYKKNNRYYMERHHALAAPTPGAKFGGMNPHGVAPVRPAAPGAPGNPKPTRKMLRQQKKTKRQLARARKRPGGIRGDVNPNAGGQYAQAVRQRIDSNPNMPRYIQQRQMDLANKYPSL